MVSHFLFKIDPSRVNYTAMEHRRKVVTSHLPGWETVNDNLSYEDKKSIHNEISKHIPKSGHIDLFYILCKYYSYLRRLYWLEPMPSKGWRYWYSITDKTINNTFNKLINVMNNILLCPKWDLDYSIDIIEMNMKDLKKQVLKNNGVVIGNKTYKNTWAKAYINLQNISLSMVKMRVPDDVGSLIGEYLPSRDTQFTIFVGSAVWMTREHYDLMDLLFELIERSTLC